MTIDELRTLVERGAVDTVIVAFTDLYGRLLGKRLDADFFLSHAAEQGTHACDYLLTVDVELEVIDGYEFANWECGYGDVHLLPDLVTLRRAGWTEGTVIVLCDVASVDDDADVAVAPRQMLRRQLDRLTDRGLAARAASELEFYLYTDSYRSAHDLGYSDLTPGGWYAEDYDLLQGGRHEPYLRRARAMLTRSDIPVENSKGETGVGQHELNIAHAPLLEMADRHTVMKHAMKALADELGVSVTFMAKPTTDDAGSSCHLHVSLWDGDTNAFEGMTDTFRWFLGGWMALVDDFMVCYAPTVNSYKRYVDSSWAPTRVTWARDNRTASFRIVGDGPSTRIECRIPGADCNPYLAYAATLASGLAGIEEQIEPPPAFDGDAYRSTAARRVPATLDDAIDHFANSEAADSAFGPEVVAHYTHFFRTEAEHARRAVTDWERARYFERI